MDDNKVGGGTALVTGGARRIGAAIARHLHRAGMNLTIHYRHSQRDAVSLAAELEAMRPDSVDLFKADLLDINQLRTLIEQTMARWGRIDTLVNNASSFYPTPLDEATEAQWDDLIGSNMKAPFFLAQAAAPHLRASHGCIVNVIDIHAQRPRDRHPVYSCAKAGLAMLTQALAWELRPTVRVNGVAPGAILWSAASATAEAQEAMLQRIALGRPGSADDIARAVLFLVRDAGYVSGQILGVDGGRSVHM